MAVLLLGGMDPSDRGDGFTMIQNRSGLRHVNGLRLERLAVVSSEIRPSILPLHFNVRCWKFDAKCSQQVGSHRLADMEGVDLEFVRSLGLERVLEGFEPSNRARDTVRIEQGCFLAANPGDEGSLGKDAGKGGFHFAIAHEHQHGKEGRIWKIQEA